MFVVDLRNTTTPSAAVAVAVAMMVILMLTIVEKAMVAGLMVLVVTRMAMSPSPHSRGFLLCCLCLRLLSIHPGQMAVAKEMKVMVALTTRMMVW